MENDFNGSILAGIDGSDLGQAVLDYAIWLSKSTDCPLQLLNTIEHDHRNEQSIVHGGNLTPNIRDRLLDELSAEERKASKKQIAEGKQILNDGKRHAEAQGVKSLTTTQRHGNLPEALLDLQAQIAMVVLGSTGRDHEGKLESLGAQLEQAIRVINKPAFIVKSEFSQPQHVMLAYNGSSSSQKALKLLQNLCSLQQGLTIHIVSVQKDLVEAQKLIDFTVSQLQTYPVQLITQALVGEPVSALISYQNQHGIDLTIMGAFSHGKLHGMFFGSFTSEILLKSQTQFLLVS